MSLIAGTMGAFFLFSGYFLPKEQTPKFWIFMRYLSLFKCPFESFLINEFGGEKGHSKCVEGSERACFLKGDDFLRKLGIDESQKWNLVQILQEQKLKEESIQTAAAAAH
ncbi:hypothetical protein ACH5RR_028621 [Cinchona calisaya]|uniref:ABC-2 type transporter transmembrane domain-containing protein n=1 Tax=Cinchona calisaya TaxID=153742 RepID=A0ABD2YSY7_9GENT